MSQTLVNRKRAQFLSLRGGNKYIFYKNLHHLRPPLLCQQTGINNMIFDSDLHSPMRQYARFSQTKVKSTKQVSTSGCLCLKVVILALTLFV